MNAQSKEVAGDIVALMQGLGEAARTAAQALARADSAAKSKALQAAAQALRASQAEILQANARDMAASADKGLSGAMLDRLLLNAERVESMARGLEAIDALPDPVGEVMAAWDRPNGLHIERVRVPLALSASFMKAGPM